MASPVSVAPSGGASAVTSPPAAAVGPGSVKTPFAADAAVESPQASVSTVLETSKSTAPSVVVGKRRVPTGEQVSESERDFWSRCREPNSLVSVGEWAGLAAPSPVMLGRQRRKPQGYGANACFEPRCHGE